jgi:hypothetical protein
MLKLKDNVNLKELEKFGFTRCEPDEYYNVDEERNKSVKYIYWENGFGTMDIDADTREIWGISSSKGDILFDLIQAELVEKVK